MTRVLGLGLTEYAKSWLTSGGHRLNEELFTARSKGIAAERQPCADGALSTEAVPRRMKPKTYKQ
eukprot:6211822-Pleurochrysis_carterae.AAC.5